MQCAVIFAPKNAHQTAHDLIIKNHSSIQYTTPKP